MLQEDETTTEQAEIVEQKYLPPSGEIVLGEISGIDDSGQPQVIFSLEKRYGPVVAMATIPITATHVGRQVGLLFAQGREKTPVIIGMIHNALQNLLDNIEIAEAVDEQSMSATKTPSPDSSAKSKFTFDKVSDVVVEGKKIIFQGEEEVVLRCGDSSITLHRNGKISIRGKYLLNRSSGVNRIMGGSVQVN